MKDPLVLFFVNANKLIGGGHLVRCLLLAKALQERNIPTLLIVTNTDQGFLNYLKSNKQDYTKERGSITDITQLINTKISERPGSLLIVDTDDPDYHSVDFQKDILRSGGRLMIITNKPRAPYFAHILLNQNPIAFTQDYKTEAYTKKLFGPEYFILSEPFRVVIPAVTLIKHPPYNVFISFGTTDSFNITLTVLQSLDRMGKKELIHEITVVAGMQNPHIISLKKQIKNTNLNVKFKINPTDIRSLMLAADIAITSTGLTFWELASVKVPSLIIPASERELETAKYLHNNRLSYQIGRYDQLSDLDKIASEIESVLSYLPDKKIDINRFDKIIDPMGIDKVTMEIQNILNN